MAIGRTNTATPPPTQQSAANERLIQQQLRRTMRYVKLVDLFGGIMVLATIVLLVALSAAIIDAWLVDLAVAGRLAVLAVILVLATGYLLLFVTPLVLRRINPEFAARMIEDSKPSLKNSLINFLTFQSRRRTPAQQVVYQALENQAASDLSQVPVESAVDRSKLITAGYVLAGVMVVCALYKVLSPKDPFQTLARIAAPLADIDRPSRVQILAVQPGDLDVFHGDLVSVQVQVDGIHAADQVELWFSTADGQLIDQRIEMAPANDAQTFAAELSPGGSGVQQSLAYHITAGDAVSPLYRVTVVAAPTIVVDSVQYDYPAYTKRPTHVAEDQGDVRGLEGTKVTVRCRANHPIQHAYLELEPPANTVSGSGSNGPPQRPNPKIVLQSQDRQASGTFQLRLQADRATPLFASYQVHFVTIDGHTNKQPIEHQINVLPDLPPEIEILAPARQAIQVPENGTASIEIRAIDPDYGLRQLTLHGVAGDEAVVHVPLLNDPEGRVGQVVATHRLIPRKLGLTAGAELRYWAVAEDNRVSPVSGNPDPGSTRTRPDYVIQVVEPARTEDGFGPGATNPAGAAGENGDSSSDRDARSGESEEPGGSGSTAERRSGAAEGDATDTAENGSGEQSGSRRQTPSQAGSQSGNSSAENAGSEARGSSEQSASSTSSSSPGNAGQAGANTPGKAGAKGDRASQNSSGQASSPGHENSEQGKTPVDRQRSEPLHPGEVFDKVLRRIEQQDRDGGASKSPAGGSTGEARDSARQSSSSPDPGESGSDGSAPQPGQSANQSAPPGASQPAGPKGQNPSPKSPPSGCTNQSNNTQQPDSQSSSGQEQGQSPSGPTSSGGARSRQAQQDQGGGANQPQGQPASSQPNPSTSSGGSTPQSSGQQSSGQQSGGQQSDQQRGGQQSGGQKSGANEPGDQQGGQQSGGGQSGGSQSQQNQRQSGGGGGSQQQSGGSQNPRQQNQPQGGAGQQGGQGQGGEKGSGQDSQSGGGSPAAQGQNQDRRKQQSGGGQQQAQGAQSPGQSRSQSNSQGDQRGDQSGGAGSGGGQSSGRAGSDSSGGSTLSEQGGQSSNQPGGRDPSARPGDSQPAGHETGRSGSETGRGAQTRRSSSGNQQVAGRAGPGNRDGSPRSGGGGNPSSVVSEQIEDQQRPAADEANLEYARKATDLALEYLRDQQDNPDERLLDDLDWNADELREFVERWDNLKRRAKDDRVDGGRELDEALRSLGLRPRRDKRRAAGAISDDFQDYGDAGQASRPPDQFLEKFNAFLKGTARSEKEK